MELNRYRKVIYLPNASAAQDSSAIKGRYLEMIRMAYVPVQIHCGDTVGQYLDYKADFAKRSLKLEPVVVDHSQPDQPKSIILPLKGKAVTFSDVNSTDLEILHNNAAIILRFTNDLDRDAFALMCVNAFFLVTSHFVTPCNTGFLATPAAWTPRSSASLSQCPGCPVQPSCQTR